MAELLWDCGYEEQDRRTKLMAVSPYSNVHMETMEVTQNKEKKSYKTRNTWIFCTSGGKQPQEILVCNGNGSGQQSINTRKTDKQWLLWFSYCLSVRACQLLKPPCTERYARWCERTGVNHSLLLDFLGNMNRIVHLWEGTWEGRRWRYDSIPENGQLTVYEEVSCYGISGTEQFVLRI